MPGFCRPAGFLVGLWLVVCVPGCSGERHVKITGKLLKNGQPLVVNRDFYVTLAFIPDGATGPQPTQPAKFKRATGEYEIDVRPGKYRVHYTIVEKNQPPWPMPPGQAAKIYDLTENQQLDIEVKSQ